MKIRLWVLWEFAQFWIYRHRYGLAVTAFAVIFYTALIAMAYFPENIFFADF